MNYELPAELWSAVVPLSALIGAIGGLIWEIGNAVRRSQADPELGLGNTIELPRCHRTKSKRSLIELGVLGPMAVGAVSGVLFVLLVGAGGPSPENVANAVVTATTVTDAPQATPTGSPQSETKGQPSPAGKTGGREAGESGSANGGGTTTESAPTPAEATEVVEEELSTSVSGVQLISLALLGGLAGWGLIQSLTTRLTDVFGGLIGKTAQSAGEEAKKTIEQAVSTAQPAMLRQDVERIAEEGAEKVESAAAAAVVADLKDGAGGG